MLLRRAGGFRPITADGGLGGGQTGDRHAIGAAAYVVHADAVAEADAGGFAAMLAADADFEIVAGFATFLDSHLHQLADAFLVEDGEWVVGEDLLVLVVLLELRVVVARKTHGGLREIIGAEAEEFGFLGDAVSGQG